MALTEHQSVNEAEEKYRKDSRWLSFKSQAWGALGMATFFGALVSIATGIVSLAMGIPSVLENGMITPSAPLLSFAGLTALGGLIGFGALATYMSQRDATELRIVQDEHMAQQQVKCMKQDKCFIPPMEYEQNRRSDGKTWGSVIHQETAIEQTANR